MGTSIGQNTRFVRVNMNNILFCIGRRTRCCSYPWSSESSCFLLSDIRCRRAFLVDLHTHSVPSYQTLLAGVAQRGHVFSWRGHFGWVRRIISPTRRSPETRWVSAEAGVGRWSIKAMQQQRPTHQKVDPRISLVDRRALVCHSVDF